MITPGTAFLRQLTFLSSFNGVYIFRNEIWENSTKLQLFTDAPAPLFSARFSAMLGAMGDGLTIGCIVISLFWSFFLSSSVYAYAVTKCGIILSCFCGQ